jgi:hypothetical protein
VPKSDSLKVDHQFTGQLGQLVCCTQGNGPNLDREWVDIHDGRISAGVFFANTVLGSSGYFWATMHPLLRHRGGGVCGPRGESGATDRPPPGLKYKACPHGSADCIANHAQLATVRLDPKVFGESQPTDLSPVVHFDHGFLYASLATMEEILPKSTTVSVSSSSPRPLTRSRSA